MDLGSLIGNVASGGILGAVGGIAQGALQMWQAKQAADHEREMRVIDHAHEASRWSHDLEIAKFESEAKTKLAEIDSETKKSLADTQALADSFTADKRTFATDEVVGKFPTLFALVDFVRGIIRPWITLYLDFVLTILCGWVTYEVIHYFPQVLTQGNTMADVFKSLVEAIIFMSTTSTMWWFAARGIKVSLK
jgi:hypothetical protein